MHCTEWAPTCQRSHQITSVFCKVDQRAKLISLKDLNLHVTQSEILCRYQKGEMAQCVIECAMEQVVAEERARSL